MTDKNTMAIWHERRFHEAGTVAECDECMISVLRNQLEDPQPFRDRITDHMLASRDRIANKGRI